MYLYIFVVVVVVVVICLLLVWWSKDTRFGKGLVHIYFVKTLLEKISINVWNEMVIWSSLKHLKYGGLSSFWC